MSKPYKCAYSVQVHAVMWCVHMKIEISILERKEREIIKWDIL